LGCCNLNLQCERESVRFCGVSLPWDRLVPLEGTNSGEGDLGFKWVAKEWVGRMADVGRGATDGRIGRGWWPTEYISFLKFWATK